MVFTRNEEEAVSPVIGTVLMVAITVILAAVIAMYVFGMPAHVTKTNIVAATAQLDKTGVILVTYQGGQDDESMSSLDITAPNGTVSSYANPDVGAVMKLIPPSPTDWPTGQKHVVVIAAFSNGPNQIILDTFV
jgi:flagellin-like protein